MEPQTPGNPPTPTPQSPVDAQPTSPIAITTPNPTFSPASEAPTEPPVGPSPIMTPPASEKYKVFTAIKDVIASVKNNPIATLVPLVLGYVASILLTFLTFFISGMALATTMPNAGFEAIVFIIPVIIFSVIVGALAQLAFTSASMLAIKESFEGTQRSLGVYLGQSFRLFGKVLVVTLLFIARVGWPVLVANILLVVGLLIEPLRATMSMLGFLVSAGTTAWVLVGAIRYNLFWQVAIFEPALTAKQTLTRSRELVKGRGEWFIIRTALLVVVLSFIINAVSGGNINNVDSTNSSWLSLILLVVMTPFAFGIPTMLYLHLSGTKKQPVQPQSQPQVPVQTL